MPQAAIAASGQATVLPLGGIVAALLAAGAR
jgi:hypothetical protein